jgi:hypothetical protein
MGVTGFDLGEPGKGSMPRNCKDGRDNNPSPIKCQRTVDV